MLSLSESDILLASVPHSGHFQGAWNWITNSTLIVLKCTAKWWTHFVGLRTRLLLWRLSNTSIQNTPKQSENAAIEDVGICRFEEDWPWTAWSRSDCGWTRSRVGGTTASTSRRSCVRPRAGRARWWVDHLPWTDTVLPVRAYQPFTNDTYRQAFQRQTVHANTVCLVTCIRLQVSVTEIVFFSRNSCE